MKYFVVSDIHSFAKELKSALRKAGFNKKNKDHTLIVCGDIFDRGEDSLGVYKYIRSIPKSRRILVKGNHEDLYMELLEKYLPDQWDYSNGTVDTFCHIAGYSPEVMTPRHWYKLGQDPYEKIKETWRVIVGLVKRHPVTAWLKSDEWVNYCEIGNYIFVHSFIPLINDDNLPPQYIRNRMFRYMPDWRSKATEDDWYAARWGCPWKNYSQGLFDKEAMNGKILVCGHWNVSEFWSNLAHEYGNNTNIYYSRNLIGLDGGCWSYRGVPGLFHPQNVLVIDGDTCYDQFRDKLVYIDEPYKIIETVPAEEVNE